MQILIMILYPLYCGIILYLTIYLAVQNIITPEANKLFGKPTKERPTRKTWLERYNKLFKIKPTKVATLEDISKLRKD